jgi:hypothetical protein
MRWHTPSQGEHIACLPAGDEIPRKVETKVMREFKPRPHLGLRFERSSGRHFRRGGAVALSLVAALIIGVVVVFASADQEPPYRCSTSPSYGFTRWHYGLWNFCATDSYGPPEWMYWNYLPGTTGYNNPGAGPYYSLVATAVGDWASAQPNWKFTYKDGDWNSDTDLFLWSQDLGGGIKGRIIPYWCTSSTSCTERTGFDQGPYNLVYLILDDTGVTRGIVNHEMGHALGLKHPTTSCFYDPSVMYTGTECLDRAGADDAAAVDWVYPDP